MLGLESTGDLPTGMNILHPPDSLLLLDPARGEQRFASLWAQEAVSQKQGREGNQGKEGWTMSVQC